MINMFRIVAILILLTCSVIGQDSKINIDQSINIESISLKNWSERQDNQTWNWGIYVDANKETLNKIHYVKYELHRSFPNRIRFSKNRENRFELSSRGWGVFTVYVTVYFVDDSSRNMKHFLVLR